MVMPAQSDQLGDLEAAVGVGGQVQPVVPAPHAMDPEMKLPRAASKRRSFTAKEKMRILGETDAAAGSGEIGSILRREGLYASVLQRWRRQRDQGLLSVLAPAKRGPVKAQPKSCESEENKKLRHEVSVLRERLARAETIIDFQKKVSELLAIPLSRPKCYSSA